MLSSNRLRASVVSFFCLDLPIWALVVFKAKERYIIVPPFFILYLTMQQHSVTTVPDFCGMSVASFWVLKPVASIEYCVNSLVTLAAVKKKQRKNQKQKYAKY